MESATATEEAVVTSEVIDRKFDRVVIDYHTHNRDKNFDEWETMDIEEQRELLAHGQVRFFKEQDEVPFYKALL